MTVIAPDIITTRATEWFAFWRRRVAEYWSLGVVDAPWRYR